MRFEYHKPWDCGKFKWSPWYTKLSAWTFARWENGKRIRLLGVVIIRD